MHIPHDYHIHTAFSIDCDTPMDAFCARAVALGIPEICFTEHADFVPRDEGCGYFQPAAYFAELERCRASYRGRLTIRAGVEISEPHRFPDHAARLRERYPFDFVIGSLHWVGDELALMRAYFEGKDEHAAYAAYFDELLRMVIVGGFDVLGHLDVPKRAGFDVHGRSYDARRFAEPIRAVLAACVARGIGLEINTGTLRRAVAETSPTPAVLRQYRTLGGEILTLGSDAHGADALAHRFDLALELARSIGFGHITCFKRRRPRAMPIV